MMTISTGPKCSSKSNSTCISSEIFPSSCCTSSAVLVEPVAESSVSSEAIPRLSSLISICVLAMILACCLRFARSFSSWSTSFSRASAWQRSVSYISAYSVQKRAYLLRSLREGWNLSFLFLDLGFKLGDLSVLQISACVRDIQELSKRRQLPLPLLDIIVCILETCFGGLV